MLTTTEKDQTISGQNFLQSFSKLTQISKLYRQDNQLFINNAAEFLGAINRISKSGEQVNLRLFRGRFYLNEERFVHPSSMLAIVTQLAELFQRCNIPGFYIQNTGLISTADIINFFALLNKAEHMEEPAGWLQRRLESGDDPWIGILPEQEDFAVMSHGRGGGSGPRGTELEEIAKGAYSHALTTMMALTEKLSSQRRVGIQKPKRVIQDMMAILTEDESVLLAMSTIRDFDDYTYTHSVNVAILCLCLGKRIGLPRNLIEQLGLCGLFHDLGKVNISYKVITKESTLTSEEYEEIKRHSLYSVQQIIRLNTDHKLKAKLLLPPFEHHLGVDLSGYPQSDRKVPLSLMGRILAVADNYDALTSNRSYRRAPISPDRALGIMMEETGTKLDIIILKVFVNMMGTYPIGAILTLDNGEKGIVIGTPDDSESGYPVVFLLRETEDGKFEKGNILDLSKQNSQTKEFERKIISCSHPYEYGIQPANLLL